MEIKTGTDDRKKLVKRISDFIGEASVYLGPPTFSYQVGEFMVDRSGTIYTEDDEKGTTVLRMLIDEGYVSDENQGENQEVNQEVNQGENVEETVTADIKIPLEGFNGQQMKNLVNMIYSKQYLINKSVGKEIIKIDDALIKKLEALGVDDEEKILSFLSESKIKGIQFDNGCITFLEFPTDEERTKAYMELASRIVKTSKESTNVRANRTEPLNEKYYMRVWLVRLGLDGKEFKEVRKTLLKNLKGHTAFRTEEDKIKWNERQQLRKAEREGVSDGISE